MRCAFLRVACLHTCAGVVVPRLQHVGHEGLRVGHSRRVDDVRDQRGEGAGEELRDDGTAGRPGEDLDLRDPHDRCGSQAARNPAASTAAYMLFGVRACRRGARAGCDGAQHGLGRHPPTHGSQARCCCRTRGAACQPLCVHRWTHIAARAHLARCVHHNVLERRVARFLAQLNDLRARSARQACRCPSEDIHLQLALRIHAV
jgi:hypothetical protein